MKKAKTTVIICMVLALAWAVPLMASDIGAGKAPKMAPELSKKINLNTASKEELMTLSGIGESLAQRIIDYRKANGPFQAPDEITKVKGVGEKVYQKNQDRIKVQPEK